MSDVSVECVLQDRTGFLWAGTDDGLFRSTGTASASSAASRGCRGRGSTSSTRPPTAGSTSRPERAWRACAAAGSRSSGRTRGSDLSRSDIRAWPRMPPGTLYVGTERGLYVGRDDSFTLDQEANSPEPGAVGAVHVDASGAVFFARGGRLYRKESGRVVEFGEPRGLPDRRDHRRTLADRSGRLWVRTVKRLFVLRPRGGALHAGRPGPSRVERVRPSGLRRPRRAPRADRAGPRVSRLRPLAADRAARRPSRRTRPSRRSWTARAPCGSGLSAEASPSAWDTASSPTGPRATASRMKSSGRSRARERLRARAPLWVGTEQGLNRIDPETGAVRVFLESDGLAGNTVNAVAAGEDGSIWAGSWPGGVDAIPSGRPDAPLRRRGASPDQFRVAAIRVRPDGEVWIGAVNGLYRLAAGSAADRFQRVSLGREKPDGVRGFAEDPSGILYAASKQGILRLTGPSPRKFTRTDGLREDFVSSIAFASDGSLVVAYRESIGAAKVILQGDRLTVRPIDRSTGLVSNKVVLVGRDSSGALWIGTGSGADVFGPDWVACRPLRQGRRHDQRRPRPERLLRRARRNRVAGLEPGPDPGAGGNPAGAEAGARRRHHRLAGRQPAAGPGPLRRPRIGRAQLQRRLVRPDLHRAEQGPFSPSHARARRPVHRNGADRSALSGAAGRRVSLRGALCFGGRQGLAGARRLRARGPARLVADGLGADPLGACSPPARCSPSCAGAPGTWWPSGGAWRRRWRPAAPSSPRPTGSSARPPSPTR